MSDRRLRIGRLSVYVEPRDIWVGVYVAPAAVYFCPLPLVVLKWDRQDSDRYRTALVALVRKVEQDQTRDYFAHLVPADVLAEAFPKPTPVPPRSVSEGCSDNHREVGDDV